MSHILVPGVRPYVGRHRVLEQPAPPGDPRAQTLAELEGTTRDLHGPAGAGSAARVVWGLR